MPGNEPRVVAADDHRYDQRRDRDRQLQSEERQQAGPGEREQHRLDRDSDLDSELKSRHPAEAQPDLQWNRATVLRDQHDHAGAGDDRPDHHHDG